MPARRLLLLVPAAALAVPAVAVAVHPRADHARAAATRGVVRVNEREFSLTPSTGHVTIKNGKVTIRIHNAGKITHALSLEKAGPGGKDIRTKRIAPGQTRTISFAAKAGKIEWYCPLDHHKSLGMKGFLVVKR